MQENRIGRWGLSALDLTRRANVARPAKLVGGVALAAALLGFGWVQPSAAQDDDTIVLTAGGSTLVVSPGNASAISAVAEAHASPGHAETIAAGARAVADCEDGALAEGAAARAVAHPDQGALTESLASQIIAEARSNRDDDRPFRREVEDLCGKEKEEKKAPPKEEPAPEPAPAPEPVVVQVPVTGVGLAGAQPLTSLFAAASAAAALGAVALRRRDGILAVVADRASD